MDLVFQCTKCGDWMAHNVKTILNHMKKNHQGTSFHRKYGCIICKQVFKRCTNLRRHQSSRHGVALADPVNSLYLDEIEIIPKENMSDKNSLTTKADQSIIKVTPGNVKFRVINGQRTVFQPHQQKAAELQATPRWEKRKLTRDPTMPTTMNPNPSNEVWVPTRIYCQPQPQPQDNQTNSKSSPIE